MRQATLADEFNTLFVLHVSSPTHRRSSHCHTNYYFFPIRHQVHLLVALRGSSKPIVPPGARRARALASPHRYRPLAPLCSEGLFTLHFVRFPLSPFASDLLFSIPTFPLLLWPICHFGHRTSYTLVI